MSNQIEIEVCTGVLEWTTPHEGRLRQWKNGLIKSENDPFVPIKLKEKY